MVIDEYPFSEFLLWLTNLLKHVIEGQIGGRRGRKRKQLLDDLKEERGYCKLQAEGKH